jgi:hypothetical protein
VIKSWLLGCVGSEERQLHSSSEVTFCIDTATRQIIHTEFVSIVKAST